MSAGLTRRLRAVRDTDDAGVTLTELLVAMVLSTILGAVTLSLFVSIDTSSAATTDRTVNSSSARNTLQAWTSFLRVADGPTAGSKVNRIEWLTDHDLLFYADLQNRSMTNVGTTTGATMVWLRRDTAGRLIEEFFPVTAAANAAPAACRALTQAPADSTVPLFLPRDATGASMAAQNLGTAPVAGAGCVPLPVLVPSRSNRPDAAAQANLQNIFSVTVDFILKDSRADHPLEFTSQAVLPFLGSSS